MLCKQLIKHPARSISENDTVENAAALMRDENLGFLPVTDAAGICVGTITDRDIAVRLVAEKRSAATRVLAVMSREPVCCRPDDDLRDAEQAMSRKRISRILCIDETGQLLGVISTSDLAQHDDGWRVARTMRQITDRRGLRRP